MMKYFSGLLIMLLSTLTNVQAADTDGVEFCHGVGQAVGMIQYGRATGVEDDNNDAVKFINTLSEQADKDLLSSIDRFIRSSSPLPSAWTRVVFTHACLYNYAEDFEQIKRISRQVPFQCDVNQPDVKCYNGVLQQIAQEQVI